MEKYDEAATYAAVATNSAGTALDKYENSYLKSVAASQAEFTAQFEQFSNTVWNSDLIKGTYDMGTGLFGALTWLVDTLGSIPVLATTAAGALAALSNKGWPKNKGHNVLALYNLTVTSNESNRYLMRDCIANIPKWLVMKVISSTNDNVDGKVLLTA